MNRRRRYGMTAILLAGAMALALFAVGIVMAVSNPHSGSRAAAMAQFPLSGIKRVPPSRAMATASQIPVFVYHEMNNGCKPSAPTCQSAKDYETVSYHQFYTEMAWLHAHGFHTVTLNQYLQWLHNPAMALPRKPFLITVDNGIGNFLEGAEAALYHFRFTATAFLVTGFASGAEGHCNPPARVGNRQFNVQPGCPIANHGWDLTWSEIKALSPRVYDFALEAGASGHFQQTYNPKCNAFYACRLPRERQTRYEYRVYNEMQNAVTELANKLGRRYNPHAWVVPYSDLGYRCQDTCAYENHTDRGDWLIRFAARNFDAVFVQDYYRNGRHHERFRYEIQNTTSLPAFKAHIHHYLTIGAWR